MVRWRCAALLAALCSLRCTEACPPGLRIVSDVCVGKEIDGGHAKDGSGPVPRPVADASSEGGDSPLAPPRDGAPDVSVIPDSGVPSPSLGADAHPDSARDAAPDEPHCSGDEVVATNGWSCIPATIVVSEFGSDDRPEGTSGLPIRTFREAMKRAQRGQTVAFETGVWGPSTSLDDFKEPIPDGVTLGPARPSDTPSFDGDGTNVLTFAGDGRIYGFSINGFARPFYADRGKQELSLLSIAAQKAQAIVAGTAELSCIHCDFLFIPPTVDSYILVSDRATLDIEGTIFESSTSNDCTAPAKAAIRIEDSGRGGCAPSIKLSGIYLEGSFIQGVYDSQCGGALTITNANFEACFTDVSFAVVYTLQAGAPSVDIEGDKEATVHVSYFNGPARIWTPGSVRIRNTTILSTTGTRALDLVAGRLPLDLGTKDDPGGNTFLGNGASGVSASGPSCVLEAAGNNWVPYAQGANGQGHYAPGTPISPSDKDKTNIETYFDPPCDVRL